MTVGDEGMDAHHNSCLGFRFRVWTYPLIIFKQYLGCAEGLQNYLYLILMKDLVGTLATA